MWVICQGNPTPTFHACVYVHMHVYAQGAFFGNLSDYVASPGGPRQVSVSGCISSAHASSDALEAGASWSWQSEPSINPM